MTVLDRLLEDSARRWGIAVSLARRLFWLPVVATGAILALTLARDVFRWLLLEDGPVEWLTVIAFTGAALFAICIVVSRLKTGHHWQALLFVLVALAMIYAVGEELAWGQRVFGFVTPDGLAGINDQQEITLHNIGGLLDISNLALMLMGLYGSVAFLVNLRLHVERYWDSAEYLFVPPFFLATFFLPVFIFRMLRLFVFTESAFTLNRFSEWTEFVLGAGVMLFLLLAYLRVRSAARSEAVPYASQHPHESR